eukprot:ANDGO_01284.mRNA.1 hypothetical protein
MNNNVLAEVANSELESFGKYCNLEQDNLQAHFLGAVSEALKIENETKGFMSAVADVVRDTEAALRTAETTADDNAIGFMQSAQIAIQFIGMRSSKSTLLKSMITDVSSPSLVQQMKMRA